MDFSATLLLTCLGAAAIFLVPFWISRSRTDPTITSRVGPLLGTPDQAATPDSDTSLIPMPDHLTTKDEMVTWLIHDLPRLASGQHKHRE